MKPQNNKKRNEYTKGREDLISEMMSFCSKKIDEINSHGTHERSEINQKRHGLIAGFREVMEKLSIKQKRMDDTIGKSE